MIDDVSLKAISATGICLYFIKELIKIIHAQNKNRKNPEEAERESKATSRDKINDTNIVVKDIQKRQKKQIDPFYDMKNQMSDVHDVVTDKIDGTYIVYNPQLNKAMVDLTNTIKEQTAVLKSLK